MSSLEEQIKAAAEKAVLRIISEGSWLQPDYHNRLIMPKEMVTDVWKLIDIEAIKLKLKARLEAELADRIVNAMAAEISTDIKQILSNNERREEIRALARGYINSMISK